MRKKIKMTSIKEIVLMLLIIGIICIGLSAVYVSSYLSILGVSFLFWGCVLFYVAPSKHVPLVLLTVSNAANISNIDRILSELQFNEKAIYLPPKNLQDAESSLVFIPKSPKQSLPQPEEIKMTTLIGDKHDGLFLTPSGYALSKLFEEKLGNSFTKIDMPHLQEKMTKLFTEDFGIAESIEIHTNGNKIIIEIVGNILIDDYLETQKVSQTQNSMGYLLSSSLACALAKVTGKAITIENDALPREGKTTKIEYCLIEE